MPEKHMQRYTLTIVLYIHIAFASPCQHLHGYNAHYITGINRFDLAIQKLKASIKNKYLDQIINDSKTVLKLHHENRTAFRLDEIPGLLYEAAMISKGILSSIETIYLFENSAILYKDVFGINNILVPITYKHLGDFCYENGNFEKAISFYHEAINNDYRFSHSHFHNCRLKTAICYLRLNDYKTSKDLFTEIIDEAIEAKDTISLANTLINYGTLFAHRKEYDAALSYYQSGLELITCPYKINEYKAFVHNNRGNIYLEKQNYQQALLEYQNCNSILRVSQEIDSLLLIQNYYNLGYCHAKLENVDSALYYTKESIENNLFGKSLNDIETIQPICASIDDLILSLLDYSELLLENEGKPTSENIRIELEKTTELVFRLYSNRMMRIFDIRSKLVFAQYHDRLFNLLIQVQLNNKKDSLLLPLCDAKRDLSHYLFATNHKQDINYPVQTINSFNEEFKENDLASVMNDNTIPEHLIDRDIKNIQEMLDKETLIVSYTVIDGLVVCFSISNLEIKQKLITTKRIDSLVQDFLNRIRRIDPISDIAKDLYKQLLSSLPIDLKKYKQLIIIPDDFLSLLPFEALMDPIEGTFLIEKINISYAFSLRSLSENTAHQDNYSHEFIGISTDSLKDSHPARSNQNDQLVNAFSEVNKINDLFLSTNKSTSILYGEEAYRGLANSFLKSRYIHIASHAVYNPTDPWYSFLRLSNSEAMSDKELTIDKIYKIRLSSELLVLSACDTGSGIVFSPEGVLSFGRAFSCNNVRNLIMSLWKIDDLTTSNTMFSIYSQILAGIDITDSICQEKRKMINSGIKHPFLWAGLVHYYNSN